jgi:uncharacterized protein
MSRLLSWTYNILILRVPLLTLGVLAVVVGFASYHAMNFRLDASADSLVLESDKSLQYYRAISARYGSDEFLVLTYAPKEPLFSEPVLSDLRKLRDTLGDIESVGSVVSILDVPLVQSPPVTLSELEQNIRTLDDVDTDLEMAENELRTSHVYRQLILSEDGRTTALQVNFSRDDTYESLLQAREALREKQLLGPLLPEDEAALLEASANFDAYSAKVQASQTADIGRVREIMKDHESVADLHLGGVPMIASDSMEFVRNDLVTFGLGVIVFLIILLGLAFQRPRWVVLPMITCVSAGLIMTGVLGYFDWPVTVVSSNFISLMLIITLSLTIHLIVRYNEFLRDNPGADQRWLVVETLRAKAVPCFYTAATTIVAFGSLLVSGIQPVVEFGRMMAIGISVAFILAFTLFPAAMLLFQPGQASEKRPFSEAITQVFANLIHVAGRPVMWLSTLIFFASVWGMSQLSVENRFIDYYKPTTEIYQGMELIDRELGGTTPLDVIIDAPASFFADAGEVAEGFDDEFDDFDDDWLDEEDSSGITGTSYWFNKDKLDEVAEIHDYLDGLKQTGKTLSIINGLRVLEEIDPQAVADDFNLAILYKRLPQELKEQLLDPYLSEDGNQIRFAIRVFETDPSLRRKDLLAQIETDMVEQFGLESDQVHLTGMLVLYNNLLQSLFTSQILTIGFVFVMIMLMFIVSFRSLKLATLAIIPNVGSAFIVLGLMGWQGVPLDIMTITIAAISIGIAVDNSIHYVHRFKDEFAVDQDYWAAVFRSHGSIGRAMYYTTVAVALGFSILALSNFVPTMYFGLLTGFSMLVALVANLTLLPMLIVRFKPLGPGKLTT